MYFILVEVGLLSYFTVQEEYILECWRETRAARTVDFLLEIWSSLEEPTVVPVDKTGQSSNTIDQWEKFEGKREDDQNTI